MKMKQKIRIHDFSIVTNDELYTINGGKKNKSGEKKALDITPVVDSMIYYGDYYVDLGKSTGVIGATIGNPALTSLGGLTLLVGAVEKIIGLAIKNGDGDVSKSMDRYYEHH